MMSHVMVTGYAGSLGSAVTRKLVSLGYHVLAVDAVQGGEGYGNDDRVETYRIDLANEQAVAAFISGLKVNPEAVVLTVGGFAMGGFAETGAAELRRMVTLNFETAYHLVRALLPGFLQAGRGQFILIGARPALDPLAGRKMIAYALSKWLIFSLADLINASAGKTDVHATVIVPSVIDTPANRASMPDADFSTWVPAENIAETIAFLLSDNGKMLREPVIRIYNRS